MIENTFHYISIYWLIPVPIIFALLGLGLFHRWLGAAIVGGIALIVSLIMFDSYLNSYTEEWLGKQRIYSILFRDFPKDKDRFVSEYVRAFEQGGKKELARKHEEMKIVIMVEYAKHYIEFTPVEVLSSYIKAETWLLSVIFRKNYSLCQNYIADYKHFNEVWDVVGDDVFLTSIRYNPFIITEAIYHPQTVTNAEKTKAVELYRKLIRTLRASGAHLSNEDNKVVSCDTVYREFYALSQMPPEDAALLIKLLFSADHLNQLEPMKWLGNLMPF